MASDADSTLRRVLDPGSLVAVVDVRCVNCGRDWLDYAAALGGLVGAVVSIIALIVAARSASEARQSRDAAERSAGAAEEQLALFREEVRAARAKRARRASPVVELSLAVVPDHPGPARAVVIGVHVANLGDRSAEHFTVSVFMPEHLTMEACGPEAAGYGTPVGLISGPIPRDLGRGEEQSRYWTRTDGNLAAGADRRSWGHIKLGMPATGTRVAVEINCRDLPEGKSTAFWEIDPVNPDIREVADSESSRSRTDAAAVVSPG